MRHYATLFDRAYADKGIALYESLARHSSEPFTLHVLVMDQATLWLLDQLALPNVEILPLAVFERAMHLERIKATRTWREFCFGCASQLVEFLLPWVDDGITYCDSDIYFFADPKAIFEEIGNRSIGITPHRLIPSKKHLESNGKFNVGVVVIKNTDAGQRCATRWAAQCRERCSEAIGCSDQCYLDSWETDYPGEVCILGIGVNAAPWNIGNWEVTEGPKVDGVPIVCFHAHEFASRGDGTYRLTNYELRDSDVRHIYRLYVDAIKAAEVRIAEAEAIIAERRASVALEAERA